MYLCRYIPTLCIRNCDVVVVKKNLLGCSNFLYSNTKVQYNKIIVGKVEPDKPRHVQKDCIFQKHKTFRGVRKEYSGTRLGYFLPKIVKVYYKIYGPIFVVLLRSIIQKSFWTLTTDLKIPTNCIFSTVSSLLTHLFKGKNWTKKVFSSSSKVFKGGY